MNFIGENSCPDSRCVRCAFTLQNTPQAYREARPYSLCTQFPVREVSYLWRATTIRASNRTTLFAFNNNYGAFTGWKLLGSRQEDELNATFSSVSVSRRNPYTGISNTVASFGYPFHFNFIVNSRDQNNCVPNLHFKV